MGKLALFLFKNEVAKSFLFGLIICSILTPIIIGFFAFNYFGQLRNNQFYYYFYLQKLPQKIYHQDLSSFIISTFLTWHILIIVFILLIWFLFIVERHFIAQVEKLKANHVKEVNFSFKYI